MTAPALHLGVLAGGDPIRTRRLTGELLAALTSDEEVRAAHLTVEPAPLPDPAPGSKGSIETVGALIVLGRYFARPAADVLIAAVQSWCARDRRVAVTMTDGERSVEIVGSPTAEQQKMIETFQRGVETTGTE